MRPDHLVANRSGSEYGTVTPLEPGVYELVLSGVKTMFIRDYAKHHIENDPLHNQLQLLSCDTNTHKITAECTLQACTQIKTSEEYLALATVHCLPTSGTSTVLPYEYTYGWTIGKARSYEPAQQIELAPTQWEPNTLYLYGWKQR